MRGNHIDIIEDIGKGLNTEQLVQKPEEGEKKDDRNQQASGRSNEKDRK